MAVTHALGDELIDDDVDLFVLFESSLLHSGWRFFVTRHDEVRCHCGNCVGRLDPTAVVRKNTKQISIH